MNMERLEALRDAGYHPCRVGDLEDGDQIVILNDDALTEMRVTRISPPVSAGARQWIGVLMGGRQIHCLYDVTQDCLRKQ